MNTLTAVKNCIENVNELPGEITAEDLLPQLHLLQQVNLRVDKRFLSPEVKKASITARGVIYRTNPTETAQLLAAWKMLTNNMSAAKNIGEERERVDLYVPIICDFLWRFTKTFPLYRYSVKATDRPVGAKPLSCTFKAYEINENDEFYFIVYAGEAIGAGLPGQIPGDYMQLPREFVTNKKQKNVNGKRIVVSG